jgi:myo-inositol-1-phosphate synthase
VAEDGSLCPGDGAHKGGDATLEVALPLCVQDSPSAAGKALDVVRYREVGDDRMAVMVHRVSALLMKATPRPMGETEARTELGTMLRP